MPQHHPADELLLDYASGAAREPVALAIACHLVACDPCRARAGRIERIGAVLLERLATEPLSGAAFDPSSVSEAEPAAAGALPSNIGRLPEPMRRYLPASYDALRWRRFGSLETVRLETGAAGHSARLVRMAPGRAIQRHTHGRNEYISVFSGGFVDRGERYLPGDFCMADRTHDHSPVADPDEPCVALVVHDAPMKFTGPILRFLNPVIR